MLSVDEIDPAVPSRNLRIGDGAIDEHCRKAYAEMFPDRAARLAAHGGAAPMPRNRWGVGNDLGYRFCHKVT